MGVQSQSARLVSASYSATAKAWRQHSCGSICIALPFPSSVKISSVDRDSGVIDVLGADLADGTPIFDIKPYIEYADCHVGIRSGFTDYNAWGKLRVEFSPDVEALFPARELDALRELLAEDPRPQYHDDPDRIYGLLFHGYNVRFSVCGETLHVIEISNAPH